VSALVWLSASCKVKVKRYDRKVTLICLVFIIIGFYLLKYIIEGGAPLPFLESFQKYFGWLIFFIYITCRSRINRSETDCRLYLLSLLKLCFYAIIICSFIEFLFPNVSAFIEIRNGYDAGRVYGIAARPSSTAVLLVACLLAIINIGLDSQGTRVKYKIPLIPALFFGMAFVIISSGTGALLLVMGVLGIFFQRMPQAQRTKYLITTFAYFILTLLTIIIGVLLFELGIHLNIEYIKFLYIYKLEAINEYYDFAYFFLGRVEQDYFLYGSDFAILTLFAHIGLIGFILFLILVLFNLGFYNLTPVLLIIVSLIHYSPVLVSSGSLIFGLLLALVSLKRPVSGPMRTNLLRPTPFGP
jgi:hypothetical protein